MKTAMQELIDWLDVKIGILENEYSMSIASGIRAAKMEAEKLLEKEKEQIKNAYEQGHGDAGWTEDKYEPLEYYNQTYNQEETLEEWKSKFTHHCVIKTNQNK
jgi:prefoldin subunit 5